VIPFRAEARAQRKVIVFVYGIFSSHEIFEPMRTQMMQDPQLAGAEFHYFDYAFNEPMEVNGSRLASALLAEGLSARDQVALVAHSMGGLVSRFAILSQRLEFVRILFLLATPNAGALRLSQLTALMQLLHWGTNRFFTLFPRHSGVTSLTNAAALIEKRRPDFKNAIGIDYVSIPGRYYFEDRSRWELPRRSSGVAFTMLEAMLMRLVNVRMTRPHDGIVEEASNHLAKSSRSTEKSYSYGGPRGGRPATYGHLTLAECAEVNHVEVHSDPAIIEVVSELIALKFASPETKAFTLEGWLTSLSCEDRVTGDVQMLFDR